MTAVPGAPLRASSIALLLAALAGTPTAQLPHAPGFAARELHREHGHPLGFGGFAPGLTPGELYYAVDHAVFRRDAQGLVTLVHAFPFSSRCDLIVRPPRSTNLLYADDRSGQLRVRDLRSGHEQIHALLPNTFAIDQTAAGDLLASANPNWPAAGSRPGIWRLDPSGGAAHRELIALRGASGPLALDPVTGDLWYATAHATQPTPPGALRLLRFPAARLAAVLAGGPPIDESAAIVVATGLDYAFGLAIDDRGRALTSDAVTGRIDRFDRRGRRSEIVPAHGAAALGLVFEDRGRATFDAFQPDAGAALLVGRSDWSSFAGVDALHAARGTLSSPQGPIIPPGPLRLELAGLPADGVFVLLFHDLLPLPHEQELLRLDGVPLYLAIDLIVPPLALTGVLDPQGAASVTLPYRGGLSTNLLFQAVAVDGPRLVSSTPLSLTMQPYVLQRRSRTNRGTKRQAPAPSQRRARNSECACRKASSSAP